jgi:hypothetical protein
MVLVLLSISSKKSFAFYVVCILFLLINCVTSLSWNQNIVSKINRVTI